MTTPAQFQTYLRREMRVAQTNRVHLKGLIDALLRLKKTVKPKQQSGTARVNAREKSVEVKP